MEQVELLLVVFSDDSGAGRALKAMQRLELQGSLKIVSQAVLIKHPDGRTHVKEPGEVGPGRGALFGALVGGLVGLLGGPAGSIAGAAAGAAAGGAVGKGIDLGFSHTFLEELKSALKPGSSALVLLVEEPSLEPVLAFLTTLDGRLLRHVVRQDLRRRLERDED